MSLRQLRKRVPMTRPFHPPEGLPEGLPPEGLPPENAPRNPMPPREDLPKELPEELPKDAALLKSVLPPLLDDFQYWFGRTVELLEDQTVGFLATEHQQDLLNRVKAAQQQVSASKALSSATDSQAGIDIAVVMTWHKLVHECWSVAIRYRKEKASQREKTTVETDSSAEAH